MFKEGKYHQRDLTNNTCELQCGIPWVRRGGGRREIEGGGGGEEKKEMEGRGKEGGLWIKKDDHIPVLVYPDILKCRWNGKTFFVLTGVGFHGVVSHVWGEEGDWGGVNYQGGFKTLFQRPFNTHFLKLTYLVDFSAVFFEWLMLSFLSPSVDELLQELEKERCAKIEAERKLKGKLGAWDALFFFFFFNGVFVFLFIH